MSALYLIATISPRMEQAHEVDRILREMMAATVVESGCELYDLVIDPSQPDRWIMLEKWASRSDWEAHMQSPHNVAGNDALTDLLREPTRLQFLDPK